MPEPTLSPQPMPSAPPQGATATPGQPPIGSSPATQPVPNRGLEAAGLAKLGVVVRMLTEQVLPMVGATSEAGKDVIGCLSKLTKHVPSGSMSGGVEQSAMREMLMKAQQMAPQIAAMRNAGMGGGAPGVAPQGGVIPPQLAQLMQQKQAA